MFSIGVAFFYTPTAPAGFNPSTKWNDSRDSQYYALLSVGGL